MAVARLAVASVLIASALGAQGEIRKPGAFVAERIRVVFDSVPKPWVAEENVMDPIWAPLGLHGVNYYLYGGPTAAHAYAARSDPESPLYQAWVGAYVVRGGRAQFASGNEHQSVESARRLAELDQRSWLGATGDPSPLATSHQAFTRDTITIGGVRRTLYRFDMDSHSDLSAGQTPLAHHLGMPPVSSWGNALDPFHPLILHVYCALWRDESRNATIIVYAASSAFTPKSGAARDNGSALDPELRRMMRSARLLPIPSTH
jgi:hypothetical protein